MIKVYIGAIWGVLCVGLFLMHPIAGIAAPLVYVLYLCADSHFLPCRKLVNRLFVKQKPETELE